MNTKGLYENDDTFYEAMLRVAYLSELPRDRDYLPDVYEYLIKCLFVELGNEPSTPEAIREGVLEVFKEALDIKNVRRILKKEQGPFIKRDGYYLLPKDIYDNQKVDIDKAKSLSERFFSNWRNHLEEKYVWLTQRELDWLVEDIKTFLTIALKNYGYELLGLIVPHAKYDDRDLEKVGGEIYKLLLSRNREVDNIRRLEILRYLRGTDPETRLFLESLFRASFILLSIYSNIDLTPYLKAAFGGGKLFLDTNIIYCLVGLNLSELKEEYEKAISLSKKVGFEICVHELTRDEYESSIKKGAKRLNKVSVLEGPLREVLNDLKDDPDYDLEYVEAFIKGKWPNPEYFLSYYTNLEALLNDIEIRFENTNAYEEIIKTLVKDEIAKLMDFYRSHDYEERLDKKEFEIFQHDAYSKYYIERKRRKANKFTEVKFWFLSRDRGLANYAKTTARRDNTFPFCLSIGNWVGLLRPYVDTKNGDTFFVDLLFSEYFHVYERIGTQTIINILDFVNNIKNTSDKTKRELVMKSALDSNFLRNFERAETKEEKKIVIEAKLNEMNESLMSRVTEKDEEIESLRKAIAGQEGKMAESEIRIRQLESSSTDLMKEREALEGELQRIRNELLSARTDKDIVGEDIKNDIKKDFVAGLAKVFVCLLAAASFLFFGSISIKMIFGLSKFWRIIFAILSISSPILLFWMLPFNNKLKVLGIILAILMGITGVVHLAINII